MNQPISQAAPIGVWRLTLLVAGNIIGSGIFLLPASLAQYGSIGLLAWAFTACGALALSLMFAELSTNLGTEGGFYAYCRLAFGDFIGFQMAYSYWVALWVGNAALVVALTGYLSLFIPILQTNPILGCFTNIGIIWLITLLNIFYLRAVVVLQVVSTLLKLIPLLLIAVFGLFFLKPEHFTVWNLSHHSPLVSFKEAVMMTLWSFLGLEAASLSSNYVANPKRDIPRATLYGVMLAAAVYIIGYISIIGMMPFSELMHSSAPYADAIQPFLGQWAKQGIALLAVLSCLGSLAGWILLQGSMPLAAAKDRLFPAIFLKENQQNVPVVGLIISSTLITGLLLLQLNQNFVTQFAFIIVLATLASLIPYLLTSIAAIVLLLKHPQRFQSTRSIWRLSVASILGGLYAIWAISGVELSILFYAALLLCSSFPLYAAIRGNWFIIPSRGKDKR